MAKKIVTRELKPTDKFDLIRPYFTILEGKEYIAFDCPKCKSGWDRKNPDDKYILALYQHALSHSS